MARLSRLRSSRPRDPQRPHVPGRLLVGLAVVCILLLLLDLSGLRYGYFAYESAVGGWALTAFAAALVAVGLTALLRPLIVRRGDLYGPDDD